MTLELAIKKKETLDFLQVAESFCLFVETETSKGIEYYIKARDILITLYATAIHFPAVSITYNKEFNNRVSDVQQKIVINRLSENFGEKRFYWDTFNPKDEKEIEPMCKDLVDDLADIYRDIKSCMTTYNLGEIEAKEHGLWEIKFTFDKHCGEHNINALRALHYLVTKD
ncbi:MAG: DUF5063 domain-containing protein [Cytophagales bacterium]|jgi:hypothetical protein|nr:DUF5063 domain-containing protein [Cytophagales bacterium]